MHQILDGEVFSKIWLVGATGHPKKLRSNYLELMPAIFSLQAFVTKQNNKHVWLKIDNTTAMAVINNIGTNYSVQYN